MEYKETNIWQQRKQENKIVPAFISLSDEILENLLLIYNAYSSCPLETADDIYKTDISLSLTKYSPGVSDSLMVDLNNLRIDLINLNDDVRFEAEFERSSEESFEKLLWLSKWLKAIMAKY